MVVAAGTIVALVVVGMAVTLATTSEADTAATLDVVHEAVRHHSPADAAGKLASDGSPVGRGDAVATGAEGRATINYPDGSETRLGPNTRYTVVRLQNEVGERRIVGRLDTGETWHRVRRLSGSTTVFEVQTASAVAAVRGTTFSVACDQARTCTVRVDEGVVEVRPRRGGGAVRVTAGRETRVERGGKPGRPRPAARDTADARRDKADRSDARQPKDKTEVKEQADPNQKAEVKGKSEVRPGSDPDRAPKPKAKPDEKPGRQPAASTATQQPEPRSATREREPKEKPATQPKGERAARGEGPD